MHEFTCIWLYIIRAWTILYSFFSLPKLPLTEAGFLPGHTHPYISAFNKQDLDMGPCIDDKIIFYSSTGHLNYEPAYVSLTHSKMTHFSFRKSLSQMAFTRPPEPKVSNNMVMDLHHSHLKIFLLVRFLSTTPKPNESEPLGRWNTEKYIFWLKFFICLLLIF